MENRFRNGIINSILRNFEGKYTIVDDDSLSILLKQVETLQKMDCSDEICMKQIADAIDANEVISGTISSQNGIIYVSLRNQIRDSKNLTLYQVHVSDGISRISFRLLRWRIR